MSESSKTSDRIRYLDGFRGVCILWITLFHLLHRWKDIIPYGDSHELFLGARWGWVGVSVFFMVSGFVIFMTLERCAGFLDFLVRRWVRLFPAMLVVSLVVWSTAGFFVERPSGIPHLADLLSGILFIDPVWIRTATGYDAQMLEGTFWSLFVEAKFYLLFGAVWFLRGRKAALVTLGVAFAMALAARIGDRFHLGEPFSVAKVVLLDHLSFQYFGWFLHGALVYELSKGFSWWKLGIACGLTVIHTAYAHLFREPGSDLATLAGAVLFTVAIWLPQVRKVLSWRPLVWLGFVSYPYYLIHEGMTVSLVIKLERWLPGLPVLFYPLLATLPVLGVAWLIAAYPERILRTYLGLRLVEARGASSSR